MTNSHAKHTGLGLHQQSEAGAALHDIEMGFELPALLTPGVDAGTQPHLVGYSILVAADHIRAAVGQVGDPRDGSAALVHGLSRGLVRQPPRTLELPVERLPG